MKEVSDFISTVGFPIVVSLLMIYQQEKISQSYIDIVQSLKELISDNKLIDLYNKNIGGVSNEDKQETSANVSNNQ